jgi:O-antigen/teichoic acid export membrane protein
VLTSIAAAIARCLAMVTPLVTIPLTLRYLGQEIYGLWMAVTSLVGMFVFADLGLGNGLLTKLSRSEGRGDRSESRRLVSTTTFLLTAIALFLACAAAVAWPLVDWSTVVNAQTVVASSLVGSVVGVQAICFIISLPLTTVQRTQMALQEGFQTHLFQSFGSLLAMVAVLGAVWLKLSPPLVVLAASAAPLAATAGNWVWFFYFAKRDLRPSWASALGSDASALLRTGGAFFALSILTTVGLYADNLIVAHLCGLEAVTTYAVPARIALMLSAVVNMICSPMWAANGEALARGDAAWVHRNTVRLFKVSVGFTAVFAGLFTAFGQHALRWWLSGQYDASTALLGGLAFNAVVLASSAPFFMLLNGANVIRAQVLVFLVFTPLSIGVKALSLHFVGLSAMPWAGALCYAVIVLPAVICCSRRVLGAQIAR